MATPQENRLAYEHGFNAGLLGHEPERRDNQQYMSGYWYGCAVREENRNERTI